MRLMLHCMPVLAALTVLGAACSAQNVASDAVSQAGEKAGALETAHRQTISAAGGSQVRIVRLSQVKGDVRLDRNTDQKFELAFLNLPIIAGERLKTMEGLAEVEFEDNSSLRLTPNSLAEFPTLGRDAMGATTTTVKLLKGSLYVSLADSKANGSFTVNAGNETMTIAPASHLRLDLQDSTAKLVVFKGSVSVADASGTTLVGKKKAITFDTASSAPPVFAHNDGDAVFDKWDKTEADYHQARSASSSFVNAPYAYGTTDLNYYGSFADYGGCGSLWRPYLASAAWNPYGSGVWSYYPGSGYSWVSPYPWGWTPYHTGSWEYCAGSSSWGWRPGGSWNGLNNLQAATSVRGVSRPAPPSAPRPGQPTLVAVNMAAAPVSSVNAKNDFVFRGNSAGLGVPRSAFTNLGKISQSLGQGSSVSRSISDSQAERGLIAINRPAAAAATPSSMAAYSPGTVGTAAPSSPARAVASMPSSSAGGSHGGPASSGGAHH